MIDMLKRMLAERELEMKKLVVSLNWTCCFVLFMVFDIGRRLWTFRFWQYKNEGKHNFLIFVCGFFILQKKLSYNSY